MFYLYLFVICYWSADAAINYNTTLYEILLCDLSSGNQLSVGVGTDCVRFKNSELNLA